MGLVFKAVQLLRRTGGFAVELWRQKRLIFDFSRRDFQKRYTRSFLGVLWAFINPVVMLLILWFLFTVGFKTTRVGNLGLPFFVWLTTAILPWNYFSEAVSSSTTVIKEYSFLVNKVNFRLSILPAVKLFTALLLHLVFLVVLAVILIAYGFYPSWHWLQAIYYLFCGSLLILAISWLTAALNVFFSDVTQIVNIMLSLGFWITPIFWEINMVPAKYRALFKLNPVWYVVEGYRKVFLYRMPLWEESWKATLWFWGFTLLLLLLGITVFRRLRPHFADTL